VGQDHADVLIADQDADGVSLQIVHGGLLSLEEHALRAHPIVLASGSQSMLKSTIIACILGVFASARSR
jgi:hypothetical protein